MKFIAHQSMHSSSLYTHSTYRATTTTRKERERREVFDLIHRKRPSILFKLNLRGERQRPTGH